MRKTAPLLRLFGPLTLLFAACLFSPDLSRYPPCERDADCEATHFCEVSAGRCLSLCGDVACEPHSPSVTPSLALMGVPLPPALELTAYDRTLSAGEGTPPYRFGVSQGELPPGVSLSADGRLSGTPERAGVFLFELTVSDASPARKVLVRATRLEVLPLLRIGTLGLTEAEVSSPYVEGLYATGGQPPYRWSLVEDAGMPPAGIALHPDGGLRGIASDVGTVGFAVRVSDSADAGQERTAGLLLSVAQASVVLGIATPSLAEGREGWEYRQRVQARGGSAPYLFRIASGGLPPGLSLDELTGEIDGTPLQSGGFSVRIEASDMTGLTASRPFNVLIR